MLKRILLIVAVAALPFQANALDTEDLLALVAMPLAVAAVSEATDVPMSDLMDVVTLLNDAEVPPVQFIEVVRYAPVAFVANVEPDFDDVLRSRIAEGVRGPALITVIEEQFVAYGLRDVDLDTARVVTVVNEPFLPPVVRTRIAEGKAHPHGGPPGQLKKQRGLQTGAEVVHGSTRTRVVVSKQEEPRVVKVHREKSVKPKRVVVHEIDDRGKGHGGGKGGEKHGGGKGHGKGKG